MRHTLLPSLFLSLVACNATQTVRHFDIEPLDSLGKIDLVYRGALSDAGLPKASAPSHAGDILNSPQVETQVRIYEVTKDAIHQFLQPEIARIRADRVNTDAALEILERLVQSGDATLHSNPRILLSRGGRSNLEVSNTFSYVDSYEIKQVGLGSLGDPNVKVGRDGVLLEVAPLEQDAAGQCSVDIKLSLSTLRRPVPDITIQLPGSQGKVVVHSPLYSTQELSFRSVLNADETLVVGPLLPIKGERPLIVLVTTKALSSPAGQESFDCSALKTQ